MDRYQFRSRRQASTSNSASSCYDCSSQGCKNFGTCISGGGCICPLGFGGVDCGSPVCNSPNVPNTERAVRPYNTACKCDDGFTGPTCNICTSDSSCNVVKNSIGSLALNSVCNRSPVIWKAGETYCLVDSPTIRSIYPDNTSISFFKNISTGTILASLWYGNLEQFSCMMSGCNQTMVDSNYQHFCSDTKCKCQKDSAWCGGAGSTFNLGGPINTANGFFKTTCSNSTNCQLDFGFLKILLPDGLNLVNCQHGECAKETDNTGLQSTVLEKGLSPLGIAGIVLSLFIGVTVLVVYIWALIHRAYAVKKGKPTIRKGVNVTFSNISYHIDEKRKILSNVSGAAKSGQVFAIMGPSGSGKTTLLDILAGKSKSGTILGTVTLGNETIPISKLRQFIGYVDQEDLLIPTLTVRETLLFSAALRLPECVTMKEKMVKVDEVMDALGLTHIAESLIGGDGKRGISGGEKRRVSIGIELVTNPPVLLLDEPTSGLDSYNAFSVISTLANLAKREDKTIVFTIHQPRSDIYKLFDSILILTKGMPLYSGQRITLANHFSSMGHPCPADYNMADHLLDLASSETIVSDLLISNSETEQKPVKVRRESFARRMSGAVVEHMSEIYSKDFRAGYLTQMSMLFKRSYKILIRTPGLLLAHWILSIVLGIFIGCLFLRSDNTLGGVQNRLGSILFILSLLGFSSVSAIASFNSERLVFLRERNRCFYGPITYYITKILFDTILLRLIPSLFLGVIAFYMIGFNADGDRFSKYIVIIGIFGMNMGLLCMTMAILVRNMGTATLSAVIIILFKMLFSGLLINQDSIPAPLKWIQFTSFFRYAFEALIVNDLARTQISDTVSGATVDIPAALILWKFGFDLDSYWRNLLISFGILISLLFLNGTLIKIILQEKK